MTASLDTRWLQGADPRLPLIRELSTADRLALTFIFRHLGETSRYQRFLSRKSELSERELDHLTAVDHWHREALIAWSPVPRAPIAVARYERCDEFDLAELAIAVVDRWQRHGVGGELMLTLRERALRTGIRRFTATMLASNRGALALVRRLAPDVAVHYHDGIAELSGSWH